MVEKAKARSSNHNARLSKGRYSDTGMRVTLLVGGSGDTYYELGLVSGLVSNGVHVDFVGSDFLKDSEALKDRNVSFYNLRGDQSPNTPILEKIGRVLRFYWRLIRYAFRSHSEVFHIQWMTKFVYFDRTVLNLYYKALGKKLILTAHNVNAAVRDEKDSFLNRLTLKFMYQMMQHVIVHTNSMKRQLIESFHIPDYKVSVVPYGINNMVYQSELTCSEARRLLGLASDQKVLLFFGVISPYKGLEYLLLALAERVKRIENLRLIIAGRVTNRSKEYWTEIERIKKANRLEDYLIERVEFIPDEEIERYFKAADVLVLPYKFIFQSGVLFMALAFGLPVIATDVGSLGDYVTEGKTGLICRPRDAEDLGDKIERYFESRLFKDLQTTRAEIIKEAMAEYSWNRIAQKTIQLYETLV